MSLLSSIQLANNALRANQIGLQVVGQNISNAATPGYIREEVVFKPGPTQRQGKLLLGLGVEVDAVIQKVDKFLLTRLRDATSDLNGAETREQAYLELETLLGELTDTDISSQLTRFFSNINEVLNQPDSSSSRNLAALTGEQLAGSLNLLSERAFNIRQDLNEQVRALGGEVNRLTEEIRRLNVQISETEGGSVSKSDAVGLRDQREIALTRLSEILDVRIDEQPSGAANIAVNGAFLVFEGQRREVNVVLSSDKGLNVAAIEFADTNEPLDSPSGQLGGLISARDEIVGGFIEKLDEFGAALAFEFNKIHSSGQGLKGFSQLESEFSLTDSTLALDAAGLTFEPVNGSFQVLLFNKQTGTTTTTDIRVDLNGLDDDDTTLDSLVADLDAIDGISASITPTGTVSLTSDSPDQEFAFAEDTSHVLAALGLNVFFTGTTARDLGVSDVILSDPTRFAASRGGIANDADNAELLANFLNAPLDAKDGDSLAELYENFVGSVTQASATQQAATEGFRVFQESLNAQHLSISGVSLDDEAVKLLQYQRAYQAAARYIAAVSELLNLLTEL
ncbi:MAG: flagellar hook-associated protein FlgK [Pirellulales bacterium]|nr:flagellar hook-associated protein FlgK [Pirellulales bacterium]